MAGLILALLVTTGTRTTIVLLVAPLAIALGARRQLAARSVRLALLGPATVAATLLFGGAFIGISGADTELLQERLAILRASGDTSGDASYNERRDQTKVAWDRFESAPILGAGPGTTFEWRTQDGVPVSNSFLDTPWCFQPSSGSSACRLCVRAREVLSFLSRLRRLEEVGIGQLALTGYLAVVLAITPLVLPFHDKAFSFGLLLVLALALQEARANSVRRSHGRTPGREGRALRLGAWRTSPRLSPPLRRCPRARRRRRRTGERCGPAIATPNDRSIVKGIRSGATSGPETRRGRAVIVAPIVRRIVRRRSTRSSR